MPKTKVVLFKVRLQKLFRRLQREVHSPEHQVIINPTQGKAKNKQLQQKMQNKFQEKYDDALKLSREVHSPEHQVIINSAQIHCPT